MEKSEQKPFKFNEEKYDITKKTYTEILRVLGIAKDDKEAEEILSQISPENGEAFGSYIKEYYQAAEPDKKIAIQKRQEAAKSALKSSQNVKISNNTKMYLSHMMGDFIPFDTVLTAGIMIGTEGDFSSLQMGCGQGKTGVITFGTYDILANKENQVGQVVVTSSTKNLARESFDETIEAYSRLEIDGQSVATEMAYISDEQIAYPLFDKDNNLITKIIKDKKGKEKEVPDTIEIPLRKKNETNEQYIESVLKVNGYKKIDELKQSSNKIKIEKILNIVNNMEKINNKTLLTEAYGKKIIMADNPTIMSHSMDGIIPKRDSNSKRRLLADEADFAILDDYKPKQKLVDFEPGESDRRISLRKTANSILQDAKIELNDKLYEMDEETQYVDFTTDGENLIMQKIKEYSKTNKNEKLNELFNFTYDALVADVMYTKGRDYQIIHSQTRRRINYF